MSSPIFIIGMTINQTISYIMSHPYFGVAMAAYGEGDSSHIEKILFEVSFHVYTVSSGNCARAYRGARRMNGPQVVEAIRDCAPPCNLDLRLPIPEVEEGCVVVSIKNTALVADAVDGLRRGSY